MNWLKDLLPFKKEHQLNHNIEINVKKIKKSSWILTGFATFTALAFTSVAGLVGIIFLFLIVLAMRSILKEAQKTQDLILQYKEVKLQFEQLNCHLSPEQKDIIKLRQEIIALETSKSDLTKAIGQLENDKTKLNSQLNTLNQEITDIADKRTQALAELNTNFAERKTSLNNHFSLLSDELQNKHDKRILDLVAEYNNRTREFNAAYDDYELKIEAQAKKLAKMKTLYKSMKHAVDRFYIAECSIHDLLLPENEITNVDELVPSVTVKLHYMDVKELKRMYKENDKVIRQTLKRYATRYTTKANATIYQLMVIALEAELQNILVNLKYTNLDKSIKLVKKTTEKYLTIATSGNQSIAPTLVKFIGEVEYLYIQAVKIEYEYYVQVTRQKEEQAALREQMRQEAEDRRILEQQRKQVEKEEEKYETEISKVTELLAATQDDEQINKLQARIAELQQQLEAVESKKEEIISRQNGQAGYVYVISNLGSFGENVFKIGMTRRLDPVDRINELSGASVPFAFDVHSFIFSDNAVELEQRMHRLLDTRRVNKINTRKEFFNVSIHEIEQLVSHIDPSAEFNKTMLAEQYHQTLSIETEALAS